MALVRSGGKRFRRGPWKVGGAQFPAGWPFGFLLPQTGLASSVYVTRPIYRRALGRQRLPFWHVMNFTPGALVSQDNEITALGNFAALCLLGNSEVGPGSYQTQFFQLVNTGSSGFRFSRDGVIDPNIIGSVNRPMIFRLPYIMPELLSLSNRTANRALVAQNMQLCIYGVKDYTL